MPVASPTSAGIFYLDGETIVVVAPVPGEARPQDFEGNDQLVKMRFGSAIHDALLKSKYVDKMKFTIMWENQSRGQAGVADERDLLRNLLPFWIENYFTHPSYLKIDNQPVLFVWQRVSA